MLPENEIPVPVPIMRLPITTASGAADSRMPTEVPTEDAEMRLPSTTAPPPPETAIETAVPLALVPLTSLSSTRASAPSTRIPWLSEPPVPVVSTTWLRRTSAPRPWTWMPVEVFASARMRSTR